MTQVSDNYRNILLSFLERRRDIAFDALQRRVIARLREAVAAGAGRENQPVTEALRWLVMGAINEEGGEHSTSGTHFGLPAMRERKSDAALETSGVPSATAQSEVRKLVRSYAMDRLLDFHPFEAILPEMYLANSGQATVSEMLCALRCATMPVLDDPNTRLDLAFTASKLFYQLLNKSQAHKVDLQAPIDGTAKGFCEFLNADDYFARLYRARYVRHGAPLVPATMELSDQGRMRPGHDFAGSMPGTYRVVPDSCYFVVAGREDRVEKKAQVRMWRS